MERVRGYGLASGERELSNQTVDVEEDRCPRCRSRLNLKRNRTTRVLFFSCSAWPNCNFTHPY